MSYPSQKTSPDLRSLGVQRDGQARVKALLVLVELGGLAAVVDGVAVVLVGAVGEVHAGDVHAGLQHLEQERGCLGYGT